MNGGSEFAISALWKRELIGGQEQSFPSPIPGKSRVNPSM